MVENGKFWKAASDDEIGSLEKNHTRDLIEVGQKVREPLAVNGSIRSSQEFLEEKTEGSKDGL